MELEEYVDGEGCSPFGGWFSDLDATAAARVTIALTRMTQGNLSSVKSVGSGVLEYRIDTGPGYRIYFGRDGEALIILLAGGTKRRQQRDIDKAQERWADYRRRK
jgi:putative addiction module killer protein